MYETALHVRDLPENDGSPVVVITSEGPAYATGVHLSYVTSSDGVLSLADKDDQGAFPVLAVSAA